MGNSRQKLTKRGNGSKNRVEITLEGPFVVLHTKHQSQSALATSRGTAVRTTQCLLTTHACREQKGAARGDIQTPATRHVQASPTVVTAAYGDQHDSSHRSYFSGRGTTRAEDAQGTPTQSHISPSILVYGENMGYHFAVAENVLAREREGIQRVEHVLGNLQITPQIRRCFPWDSNKKGL